MFWSLSDCDDEESILLRLIDGFLSSSGKISVRDRVCHPSKISLEELTSPPIGSALVVAVAASAAVVGAPDSDATSGRFVDADASVSAAASFWSVSAS